MKFVSGYLERAYRELWEEFNNVVFRWSKKGVPHIIVTTSVSTFSVCYFRRAKVFRVYSPWPSGDVAQDRVSLIDTQDVVGHIRDY